MTRRALEAGMAGLALFLALAAGSAALLTARAEAQLSDWRSIGPEGASILALAGRPGNPETLVAGGFGALFRSTDGGQSWMRGGAGLSVPDVGALHIASNGTVFAGTYFAGVYRSQDDGATFTAANTGMGDVVIFALAAEETGALWAATQTSGVFVSTNGGDTWETRSNGLPNAEVHDLLPVGNDSLYAATFAGVYLSTDSGASWAPRNQGLGNLQAVTLGARPDGTYLYVGTVSSAPQDEAGIYRSSDAGDSWTRIVSGLTNTRIADFLIDPTHPDTMWAGTQTTSLFGESGIYRSSDGGNTWGLVPGNPPARDIRMLAGIGGAVFAGSANGSTSRGGIFRSTDGEHFARSDRGIVLITCQAVASRGGLADEILAGTAGGSFREPGGAYRSLDGGLSWDEYSAGNLPAMVNVLRIASPSLLYAGTADGVWRLGGGGGNVWQRTSLSSVQVQDVALFPAPGDSLRLYAATQIGIFYSSNGGASFSPKNVGLTRPNVLALEIDPVTPSLLYAGTDSAGVFRSTDGGLEWAPFNDGVLSLEVHDLVLDGEGRLFAATGGGAFELAAGGAWEARNGGLTDLNLRRLAIYRAHRFAATASGVFRQIGDSTTDWAPWNPGLPSLDIHVVYADTSSGRLRVFAGSGSHGVYLADQPTAVALARLEVRAVPGQVELVFASAQPEDVLGFHIERRLPDEVDFASRTGDEILQGDPDYRFIDEDSRLVAGIDVWYRLVAVARDGTTEPLAPLPVAIPAAPPAGAIPLAPPRLAVFPNPFTEEALIAVTGGKGGVLRIRDVAGRTLRILPIQSDGFIGWDGKTKHGLRVPSGIYFLSLEAGGGKASARALKLQ